MIPLQPIVNYVNSQNGNSATQESQTAHTHTDSATSKAAASSLPNAKQSHFNPNMQGAGFTLKNRVSPENVGIMTKSHFTSVKIPDDTGVVREYWVWATRKVNIDGQERTFHSAILENDVDPLKNAITPILQRGLVKNPSLKDFKQINLTMETKTNGHAESNTVTLSAHNDANITAVLEENNETSQLFNTYKQIIDTIADPQRQAINRVTGQLESTLRPAEEFNQAIQKATGEQPRSSAKTNTSETTKPQNESSNGLVNAESEKLFSADAMADLNTTLRSDQLAHGLKAIQKKFDKGSKEGCVVDLSLAKVGQNTDTMDQAWTADATSANLANAYLGNCKLASKRTKPVFIPLRTGSTDKNQSDTTHYVFLCVDPNNKAYYYDPLGNPVFGITDNSDLTNGKIFGRNDLTEKLLEFQKSSRGSSTEQALAEFCLNNKISSFCPYLEKETHQKDPINCGPYGLAWYEHLCTEFGQKGKLSTWNLNEGKRFGNPAEITGFRERFGNNFPASKTYIADYNTSSKTSKATTSTSTGTPSTPTTSATATSADPSASTPSAAPTLSPAPASTSADPSASTPGAAPTSSPAPAATSANARASTPRATPSASLVPVAPSEKEDQVNVSLYNDHQSLFNKFISYQDKEHIPSLIKVLRNHKKNKNSLKTDNNTLTSYIQTKFKNSSFTPQKANELLTAIQNNSALYGAL